MKKLVVVFALLFGLSLMPMAQAVLGACTDRGG